MVTIPRPYGPGTYLYNREVTRRTQKARFDAAWEKLLLDNPKFAAVLPQLDELAGFYATHAGVPA